jgi:hypothetical protein
MAVTGNSRGLATKKKKNRANWWRRARKKHGQQVGPYFYFLEKKLCGTVGDGLFLALPYSFMSWQTLCFAKQKMQNR